MIPRCFFVPEQRQGEVVTLSGPTSHYLGQVLRLQPGAELILLDGSGDEYPARLEQLDRKVARCRLQAPHRNQAEPRTNLILVQGAPKGEKLELIVQKATELGVSRLIPLLSDHSQVRWHCERAEGKLARWRAIAREAAEQSERGHIPVIDPPVGWDALWPLLPPPERVLCCHARGGIPLKQALAALPRSEEPLALLIGPEGGWSAAELADIEGRGIGLVSQGPRVLRTETAALAAVAAVLYELEG